MAKKVLKDCFISVNGQDISTYVHEVTIETERDEVDVTGFQAVNREKLAGLGDASIGLGIWQDYSAAAIDALLFPLSNSDTPFPVIVRPSVAAVGPNNPQYAMSGLLFNYQPIAGSVGEAADIDVTINNAAPAGLTRAVA